jgi:hypothetical protein
VPAQSHACPRYRFGFDQKRDGMGEISQKETPAIKENYPIYTRKFMR